MKTMTKLWIGLGVLAIVSPIGLYMPDKFKAGNAWGEWDADKIKGLVGYVPAGLEKIASVWKALIPDYAFKGMGNAGLGHQSVAYIVSAILGIALCLGGGLLIGNLLSRKNSTLGKKK